MASNGDPLNPFKELSPAHWAQVVRQRITAVNARKRYEAITTAYATLTTDPRYAAIKDELVASLEELLHQLVEQSAKCANCAPHAIRVKMLQEVVQRPLSQVWADAQRSRLEPVEETNGV